MTSYKKVRKILPDNTAFSHKGRTCCPLPLHEFTFQPSLGISIVHATSSYPDVFGSLSDDQFVMSDSSPFFHINMSSYTYLTKHEIIYVEKYTF